jgi:DNA topoisomerase IB
LWLALRGAWRARVAVLGCAVLGKDSIEYDNTNEITPLAYKLIKKFMLKKKPEDQLFNHVQPPDLNNYFHGVMEGLSAKVFRTYNASSAPPREARARTA